MPRVPQAHLDARRLQILQAACRCFSRKGIQGTTMRDICREACASPGAIYRYFDSKDQIIEAVAALGCENTQAYLRSVATGGPAVEHLVAVIRALVAFLGSEAGRESTRLNLRFWSEGLHSPAIEHLLKEALSRACEPIGDVVRAGQDAGDFADGVDADSVARVLIATHMGLSLLSAFDPALNLGACADAWITMLRGGLKGGHAGEPADGGSPGKED